MSNDSLNYNLYQSVPLIGEDDIFKFINKRLKDREICIHKTFEDDIRFKLRLQLKKINESYYIDDNYKKFLNEIYLNIRSHSKNFMASSDTNRIKIYGYFITCFVSRHNLFTLLYVTNMWVNTKPAPYLTCSLIHVPNKCLVEQNLNVFLWNFRS